jgi:hypothetical protein
MEQEDKTINEKGIFVDGTIKLIRDKKGRFVKGATREKQEKKQKENMGNFMIKWHKENKNTDEYKQRSENIRKAKIGKKRPDMVGNKFGKGRPLSNVWDKSEEIVGLYVQENKSCKRIGEMFNCSLGTIWSILKKNGINLIPFTNHTEETKKQISAIQQGIPLEEWKGFTKFEPYGEEFNKQLKNKIRKRDNQVCMNCGIHREKLKEALHVHHINYDKKCNVEQNFISLCRNCHRFTNGNRKYWIELFQEKLSKLYDYQYSEKGEIILEVKNE